MNIKSIINKGTFNVSPAELSRISIDGDSTKLIIKQQKLNEENQYQDLFVYNMPIEVFTEHPNFSDFSIFAFDGYRTINKTDDLLPEHFANMLTKSMNSKNFLSGIRNTQYHHNFLILFPKAEPSFDNVIILLYNKNVFASDGTRVNVPVDGSLSNLYSSSEGPVDIIDYVPSISVNSEQQSVTAGENITLNVSSSLSTVYVEPVIGSTNKTRINMVDGSGTLVVYTDDLESGETVRIKFGSKYFTGITEYTKTLL